MRKIYFLFLFATILSCGKHNNNYEAISVDAALTNVISEKSEA